MPGPGMDMIGEEEKEALLEVISDGYIYRYGSENDPRFKKKVWQLEEDFAEYTCVPTHHAVAVNSGTSALLSCLWALGIGPGDEIIVPGYTFIASMSSIIFARAIPVLAEVDASLTLDPVDVEAKITPRTKAIMLVHMLGNAGHIDEIQKIASDHDLIFIEDCCQAAGAKYHGKSVGTYGQMGAFSFNVYKTITGGDGGMVITNDEELYKRAFAVHDQGHLPLRQGSEEGKRTVLGVDFRMTEFQGAVIGAQLKKMDTIVSTMRANKKQLKDQLMGIDGITFRELPDPEGETGALLVFYMPTKEAAAAVAKKLHTTTIAQSGWHVYNNMEQLLGKKTPDALQCPFTCPYYTEKGGDVSYTKNMLPQTDDWIYRAINISVGVVDAGLGSAYGINIKSTSEEIDEVAATVKAAIEECL
ncbi:MAG TPA: DegT/DnrJ/EryC1/StrS family aminotransferase [Candidatus Lokiarchaeia archaeon]|nr:DegT/DnrJ/EryC1/StrS family aminotransferase [Candidatus Lokiarchaeia archaeon]